MEENKEQKVGISKKKTFPKKEKLCSEKTITQLFKKGSAEFTYPFRILYSHDENYTETFPKVLFSVPKKNFKRSVDRNLIRRQIREAYRLHKGIFLTSVHQKKNPSYLGIVYIAKEKVSFDVIEKKLISILEKLRNNSEAKT